jgi:cytochrome c oxidase assembly protein subunit 11
MLRHGARRLAGATRGAAPSLVASRVFPGTSSTARGWIIDGWSTSTQVTKVPGCSPAGAFPNTQGPARSFASQTSSSETRDAARLRSVRAARIASSTHQQQGSANTGGIYLLALTVAMIGATYASVPLYRMFCQATGFGGTTRRKTIEDKLRETDSLPESTKAAAEARSVTISFNADVAEGMPWKFTPTQKNVVVTPGETTLAFFTAKNKSKQAVTGVATYNVQPNKAGSYFNKVQCFCFEEQRLRGGEEVDMPVFFYLDPEVRISQPKSPDCLPVQD